MRRLGGAHKFCSDEHRDQFREVSERMALETLRKGEEKLVGAPPAGFAPWIPVLESTPGEVPAGRPGPTRIMRSPLVNAHPDCGELAALSAALETNGLKSARTVVPHGAKSNAGAPRIRRPDAYLAQGPWSRRRVAGDALEPREIGNPALPGAGTVGIPAPEGDGRCGQAVRAVRSAPQAPPVPAAVAPLQATSITAMPEPAPVERQFGVPAVRPVAPGPAVPVRDALGDVAALGFSRLPKGSGATLPADLAPTAFGGVIADTRMGRPRWRRVPNPVAVATAPVASTVAPALLSCSAARPERHTGPVRLGTMPVALSLERTMGGQMPAPEPQLGVRWNRGQLEVLRCAPLDAINRLTVPCQLDPPRKAGAYRAAGVVPISAPALVERSISDHIPNYRPPAEQVPGLFVPRLRKGPLRPRMMFGANPRTEAVRQPRAQAATRNLFRREVAL